MAQGKVNGNPGAHWAGAWTATGHLNFGKLTTYLMRDEQRPLCTTQKVVMSAFVSKLCTVWTLVASQVRSKLMIPERDSSDFPFVASDIAQLHRLRRDPSAASIDDATWKDLLLEPYCAALSHEVSIFGQQALYRRLRGGMGQARPDRIRALMEEPQREQELRCQMAPLRRAEQEIATLLYQDALPAKPVWARFTWLLPLALIASLVGVMLSTLAWAALLAVLCVLFGVQMRYGTRVEQWQRSMNSLLALLRVAASLDGQDAAATAGLNRALRRSVLIGAIPEMRSYQDWFALGNVNYYFDSSQLVGANLALLRDCFEYVADLEADIALARHLRQASVFCWAVRSESGTITMEDTVHPLLPDAQPLALNLQGRGAFISGQNGIGKSTLLRTLGLNLIAARAFGFCYAKSAAVPFTPVYASMQSEDSLFGGESLYMAELRRAKELLAAAAGPHPGVYIIDEIFRGTNHLESVSAAASVLDVLAAKGVVVVSSHNLVLASLLAHRLDPLCVAADAAGVLTLSPGVLAHTNGIALLSQRGFGGDVEANAAKVFDWLSTYLAHPADCSAVLA